MKYLLGGTGNFYKANLHTHTTISDGKLSPEEVKIAYKNAGYSIVAFTDHEIMIPHNDLTDESFLAITAYEVAVNSGMDKPSYDFEKTYHLNFYSKDPNKKVSPCFSVKNMWLKQSMPYVTDEMRKVDYPIRYSIECINDMIAKSNADGFLVCYNHPVWSEQTYPDYIELKGLWGIEVYNSECTQTYGLEETDRPYDDLLKVGNKLNPIAADDMHNPQSLFGGFVMVEAEKLEYSTVMQALEKGNVFASTGPQFKKICLDGDKLIIECSDVRTIRLNTDRRFTRQAVKKEGEKLIRAEFDISRFLRETKERDNKESNAFIRITLIDDRGYKAYSRAYFEEEWS